MEGVVTAYSGTTLTVNVSKVVGTGTHTDWQISLAGDPGSGDLLSTNNLSDLANAATARTNLQVPVTGVNLVGVDANTIIADGFYTLDSTSTNLPSAAFWYLQVQSYISGYVLQIARGINDITLEYKREKVAGTWGAWQPVLSAGAQTLTTPQQVAGSCKHRRSSIWWGYPANRNTFAYRNG